MEKAYIVTGPTSGIGRATALELAKYGTIILVGRSRKKLEEIQALLKGKAVSVVCDLSEPVSVRRAAGEILALDLPVAGLVNNAGIMQMKPTRNSLGWDMSFATNHLGPFALTEALMPHLPDGTRVLFVASAVEDPERKPAVAFGFRGGRYLSAEACARGEWKPDGSKLPGGDAYATSKQCTLATAMAFARENPRLHFSALEPGINPTTGLGSEANPFLRFISKYLIPLILPLFLPFVKYLSTPKRAARVIAKIMTDASAPSGVYYDELGHPKLPSQQVRDSAFCDRVVAETRALLSQVH